MSSTHYENQLLDAIETIVDNAVSHADYDKTIRATVQSCLDENTGKYKIKYQDSTFEAYSTNLDIKYANGTQVYILVPKNNMSQTKIILHAVDKNTIEYAAADQQEQSYETIGNNILGTGEYELCSYDGETIITLYDRDNKINLIDFDETAFAENLTEAEGFLCGASFKTVLPKDQRKKGNYGITIEIDFMNNANNTIVTKSYSVDINNMNGNPYYLLNYTKQLINFEMTKENYISVKDIYIFAKNFPNTIENKPKDIFISNFQLYATRFVSDGYSLRIKTDKNYFDDKDNRNDKIEVTGIVYWNGKETDKKFDYYWFRQNNNITEESEKYINYAGAGWECLNRTIMIDSETGEYEYITDSNILNIIKANCLAINNDFKLVAVLNDYAVSKTFTIKNYSSDYTISIESNSGDTFYYDNGSPTLTAYINGLEDTTNFYYVWSKVDNNKQFSTLKETVDYNQEYKLAATGYATLQSQIEAGQAMPAASQDQLDEYLTIIKKYDIIQRVEKNHIYNVDIGSIDDHTTYLCSVFNTSRVLIGSASIVLYNKIEFEGDYNLIIENGAQTFNYDINGISPTSLLLDKPLQIQPLKISLVDGQGNLFSDNLLRQCDIKWTIPENSLIIATDSKDVELEYTLEEIYDITKVSNNIIQVELTYKDKKYYAQTTFAFVKDGEPGTNGTGVVCKIVPNTDDIINDYPMLINGILNFTPKVNNKWFKVQLWQNGSIIWEGTDTDGDAIVYWSNLINQYGSGTTDTHSFTIDNNTFSYNSYQSDGADIIKVEVRYNGNTYYNTLPLINLDLRDNNYTVKLVKDTGFRYVLYSSDGRQPKYDNVLPFTLKVTQLINGYVEDISNTNSGYALTYEWTIKGRYNADSWVSEANMKAYQVNGYKASFIPNETYTGEVVNNALEVILKKSNSVIAKIHIPIHFYLDRYGIAAINGWDGNSIVLNEDEGMILSPQVGAGSKNSSNQFTGVLIGAVKETASEDADEGLLGYYNGIRTIFLDAKTGKATFGKVGTGQIIIDPSDNEALIYGGNYVAGSSGMLINLTNPAILWGNGNFSVNTNGILSATGANISGTLTAGANSKIGPWTVSNSSIWYGNSSYGSSSGLYFGTSGLSIKNRFKVDSSGNLTANYATLRDADISGTITSTDGQIGGFTLGTNALTANLTSYRLAHYTYTQSDYDRIENIIIEEITPTEEDYEKYDFNEDKIIDSRDALRVYMIIHGALPTGYGEGDFILNTEYSEKALSILNYRGESVVSLGVEASYIKILNANTLYLPHGRVPSIEHGFSSISISSADTVTSKTVTFSKPFVDTIPTVVVSAESTNPYGAVREVTVSSISATQFTIYIRSAQTGIVDINWIAMY